MQHSIFGRAVEYDGAKDNVAIVAYVHALVLERENMPAKFRHPSRDPN